MVKKISILTCCFLLIAQVSMAAANEQSTILSGKVISSVTRAKALPFSAIVKELRVAPGDAVKKDQILMVYTLTEDAKRALEKEILVGADTESINDQIVAHEGSRAELVAARNRARQLANSGLGSKQAYSRSEGDLAALEKRITLSKKTKKKKEESFAKRLAELSIYFNTEIKAGEDLPEDLVLTSPMDGHVLSVGVGVQPEAQLLALSTPILVGKMDPMLIQVQVFEAEIGRMQVGDKAKVTIPSLQDAVFEGSVSKIAWTSASLDVSTPSYFTVELTLPNPDMQLKPGFKAIVELGK